MNRLLFALLIAFVGAGIIAGFMVVGGPGQARMERNDETRVSDLRRLGQYYRCQLDEWQRSGISPNRCSGQGQKPDLADPVTGAPYRVVGPSGTMFEICASFETDAQKHRPNGPAGLFFDGQTGCIRYRRNDPAAEWVLQ